MSSKQTECPRYERIGWYGLLGIAAVVYLAWQVMR
jgi:hypothetical protein